MVEFICSQTLYLPRFNQKCPELRIYYEWGTTGTIPGYTGRRLKRNQRADAAGIEHDVAVEAANAAVHAPNASDAAIEGVRRQRPPISICCIFL